MARYQIWNKTDPIITPSGHQFTAQEWADKWPWVKLPGAKMVITAGLINGGCAELYDNFVAIRKKQGAPITDGMSDEEVLAAIEEFEDNPPGVDEPSVEERTAALWAPASDPAEEWPAWSQPICAADAYAQGDQVSHKDKHWLCTLDSNVWEPGVYGWDEVEDG